MNKHISWRNIIINSLPFLSALIILTVVKLSIMYPGEVDEYYSRGIYPVIAGIISRLSSFIKYSLWDIFWIFLSLFVLTGLVLVFLRRIKPGKYLLRFAQMLCILYSLFYLTWGFNYFRSDIKTRLGWSSAGSGEESFRSVLDSLIVSANRTFINISPSEYREIDEALERSYSRCADILALNYPNGRRPPKTILVSSYFAKSGVSGYFGPFFNEVHINHYQLPVDYPFVVAHEKAHQFGLANEAEANLAAFIICTNSDDRRLQYSGYMHLLIYFLNDARDIPGYQTFTGKIDKQVMEDILNREKYYDKLRNRKLDEIQTAANDVYLKTQNITKGVKNYNKVVALAISWYAESGKIQMNAGPGFTAAD